MMILIDHQRVHLDRTSERWVDIYTYFPLGPEPLNFPHDQHPSSRTDNCVVHPAVVTRRTNKVIVRQTSELVFD